MNDALQTSRKITLTDVGELIASADCATEPGPRRRFGLLIFCDRDAQLKLLDEGTSVVIGRSEPAEVIVNDGSVSRQHARFVRKRDEVWVEDLESRHGTYLRGRAVERERLEPFDELVIGNVRVVLAATFEPAQPLCDANARHDGVVIENPRMKRLYEDAARAARGRLPVLVLGETGSGKEHVVQAIHRQSERRDRPFVAVNCAAIAPSLLESALFGHERGAFTGANQRSLGVFERANGGLLFLDEIGDLSMGAQASLLRAIETQKISRLGSAEEHPVDVHVIAATHCDLAAMVEEGTFRKDLFFRLNGVSLEVPPLRERVDEIEPLARLFLARATKEWSLGKREFAPDALDLLRSFAWPGNVRQLRYAIERAALLAADTAVTVADLPEYISASTPEVDSPAAYVAFSGELGLRQQLKRFERTLIDEALRRAGGNRQAAAKLLRIPLRTLFRKLRGPDASPNEARAEDA